MKILPQPVRRSSSNCWPGGVESAGERDKTEHPIF